MSKRGRTETHNFYCLNCAGVMPIARKLSAQREKMHRKRLYCPYCKKEINMVECKTYDEKLEFMKNFELGLYKEEALISMEVCNG